MLVMSGKRQAHLMFAVERRSRIMTLLNEKKSIFVQETAPLFGVTEETIRRDLKVLENQGLIVRTHGGAVLSDDVKAEFPLSIREGINISAKDAIGRHAAGLVNDGDTLILDASTSSLYVAKYIKCKKGLTVITNAERVALELSECGEITVICTGGTMRHSSLSYVGRVAENALRNFHAEKVFFSCKGFTPSRGLTDSNEQESDLRKLMIGCSNTAVFLCDHSKLDKVGYVTTAQVEDIDLFVTDSETPPEWVEKIRSLGVGVEIAENI